MNVKEKQHLCVEETRMQMLMMSDWEILGLEEFIGSLVNDATIIHLCLQAGFTIIFIIIEIKK